MPSTLDSTLLSTLPTRALLGRLLVLRGLLIAGWAAGIAWLHWGLHITMPLLPMGAVLALLGAFALMTAWRLRLDVPATQMEFLAHLLADLTAFAVLVFFSGGATNPFVSLMLVPVIIAAISLRPRWVWLLAAVAGGYYALLLFVYQPLAIADPVAAYGMHLGGMWFNFLISAALIAFFIHPHARRAARAMANWLRCVKSSCATSASSRSAPRPRWRRTSSPPRSPPSRPPLTNSPANSPTIPTSAPTASCSKNRRRRASAS